MTVMPLELRRRDDLARNRCSRQTFLDGPRMALEFQRARIARERRPEQPDNRRSQLSHFGQVCKHAHAVWLSRKPHARQVSARARDPGRSGARETSASVAHTCGLRRSAPSRSLAKTRSAASRPIRSGGIPSGMRTPRIWGERCGAGDTCQAERGNAVG